ncbi:MAG: hypothetical protein AVDCRST_MAG02-3863, partial [uncultured Rubrobacteraceae bacterium]
GHDALLVALAAGGSDLLLAPDERGVFDGERRRFPYPKARV